MKKLNIKTKNRITKIIILSIFVLVLIFPVFLIYNLTNPTKINKYMTTKIYKAPANNAFKDQVFYNAVIDAYNKKNNTSLPYTTKLTDEQLATITNVSYYGYNKDKINDTAGIEKLINLTEIYLYYNDISTINLSKNTSLTSLTLYDNNLSAIDLSHNTLLQTLNLYNNKISEINLSDNTSLTSLNLRSNKLTTIDLSHNTTLTELWLSNNNLSTIDVSSNTALKSLKLDDNNIGAIDVSKNTALTELHLSSNNLSTIDLSYNTNLKDLTLSGNSLKKIILPEFDSFDFSKISQQNISTTYLKYGEKIISPDNNYKFYLGSKIIIPSQTSLNQFVQNLGLVGFTAKIYDSENEVTSGTIYDGYILKIYNGDTEVESQKIVIFNSNSFNDDILYKAVVDAYNEENNTSLSYTTELTDEQLATITSLSYSGYKNGEKINDATGIEKLTNLRKLDLGLASGAIALGSANALTSIDLSENIKLEELRLDCNRLTSIDLSNNTSLTNLDLSYNDISTIDLSNNTSLTNLDLSYNDISTIDVSKNQSLTILNLKGNNLNSIDLSQNTALKHLNLFNNLFSLGVYPILVGEKAICKNNIKLPDQFSTSYILGDDTIVSFDAKTEEITGVKTGTTILKAKNTDPVHDATSTVILSATFTATGTIRVFDIESSKYTINKEDSYIYTGIDNDETILSNINILGDGATKEISNNKLQIKYNDQLIKEFKLVRISSNTYDLTKDYIYLGTKLDKTKITCTSCTLNENGNNLEIKYNNEVLDTRKIVRISSNTYDLTKDYIYVGTESVDTNKITCTNCSLNENGNNLEIKYNDQVLDTRNIAKISFGSLNVNNKNISIRESIAYNNFISNITTNVVTYKIINGNNDVASGNVSNGMKVNVYKGSTLLDTYNIIESDKDYLNINKLNIDGTYIKGIDTKTKVSSILTKIETTGTVTIKNKKGTTLTNSDYVGTGSIVTIKLSKDTYEYKIIVPGDISGDGEVKINDVTSIYSYFKGKATLKEIEILAGDVSKDGKVRINDITSIYSYFKGKLKSLK